MGYVADPMTPTLASLTTDQRRDLFETLVYDSAESAVAAIGQLFASTGDYDDSIDREAMFAAAAEKLDVPYNDLYDAWMASGSGWGT